MREGGRNCVILRYYICRTLAKEGPWAVHLTFRVDYNGQSSAKIRPTWLHGRLNDS